MAKLGQLTPASVDSMYARMGLSPVERLGPLQWRIVYPPDDRHGQQDLMLVSIGGQENEVFSLLVAPVASFRLSDWPRLMTIVNEHNQHMRWPTAYLEPPDEQPEQVTLGCEYFVDCTDGVNVDHLATWYRNVLAGADRLFRGVILDNQIAPVE